MTKLVIGADGLTRCGWVASVSEFVGYHDDEWGFPVKNDQKLFEKICLEGFQSGLSWRTILAKRDNFRAGFADFDFTVMADFKEQDVERLMADAGIIRHRGKIEAVINNAARAVEMVEREGSLARFFWQYEPQTPPAPQTASTCPESVALSKELKKRGWKFVGPTTAFAFMQAMGLINDHAVGCHCRALADAQRQSFKRP